MDGLVSIIVPVYNTEDKLKKCLDSIRRQTYKNWRCLLIDDGSTDRSGEICDEYNNKDNRFLVFHRNNQGVSSARNYGLENVDGDFIAFIDSDDWIEDNYLEFLISKIDDSVDMIMCHAVFEYPHSSVEILKVRPDEIVCTENNKKKYVLSSINRGYAKNVLHEEHGFLNTVWGKLYRRSTIERNSLRFNGLALSEDMIFNLYFFNFSKGFKIYNKILYHYSSDDFSSVRIFREDFREIYQEILKGIKDFIEKYYKTEKDFEDAFNSVVITAAFIVTKDYFYHASYKDSHSRKSKMKRWVSTEPYKSALKKFNKALSKNKEVTFVAYAYKYNQIWLLNIYFFLRKKFKSIIINIRKNR